LNIRGGKVQISSDSQADATPKIVLKTGEANDISLPKLSPVPANLHRLTIRAPVFVETIHESNGNPPTSRCCSYAYSPILLKSTFLSSPSSGSRFSVDSPHRSVCPHRHITAHRRPRSNIVVAGGVRRCKEVD